MVLVVLVVLVVERNASSQKSGRLCARCAFACLPEVLGHWLDSCPFLFCASYVRRESSREPGLHRPQRLYSRQRAHSLNRPYETRLGTSGAPDEVALPNNLNGLAA